MKWVHELNSSTNQLHLKKKLVKNTVGMWRTSMSTTCLQAHCCFFPQSSHVKQILKGCLASIFFPHWSHFCFIWWVLTASALWNHIVSFGWKQQCGHCPSWWIDWNPRTCILHQLQFPHRRTSKCQSHKRKDMIIHSNSHEEEPDTS